MVVISIVCHSSFSCFQGRIERRKENTRNVHSLFMMLDLNLNEHGQRMSRLVY